jgi:hydrogenase assembly chaperone HypC/HupF
MCIGIPMQVVEPRSRYALCRADGESREVDMILVGEQPAGTWVLVFLDAAREVIGAEDAARIGDALRALALVAQGETDVDHLFADLTGREPELPEHLRPQHSAGSAPYNGISPHPVPLPTGEGTPEQGGSRATPSPLPSASACGCGHFEVASSPRRACAGEGQGDGWNPRTLSSPADCR